MLQRPSIVLTVVRFNLDVILPSPITLSLYNTIALLSISPYLFFIIFSEQHSLPASHRHSVMPNCPGPHHGLSSNLASVSYQPAMKPNRTVQYSLTVAFPALPTNRRRLTLPIRAPSAFPLQRVSRYHNRPLQHSTARSTSLPSTLVILCILAFPFLSLLPLAQPTFFRPTHHFIAPTHIPISLLLSISILVVYTARACAESQVPKQEFPPSKNKGVVHIYCFCLLTSFWLVHYKWPCYSYLVSLVMVSVP